MVNFVLSLEDINKSESEFLVRDISIFLKNRELEDILVIDIDEETVDSNCITSVHPKPYDGGILYR